MRARHIKRTLRRHVFAPIFLKRKAASDPRIHITIRLQRNRKTQMIGRSKLSSTAGDLLNMIDTLKRAAKVAVFFASLAPAFAQAPSDAQRAAIRSACRSDYIAHRSEERRVGKECRSRWS